ncbi:methyltransferase domain-containing protein [Chelatococcus reniformis]|nr:methyltransferase domain-containing protein [Chelatococcus reniformis]
MAAPPLVFDRPLARRRLQRAHAGGGFVDFLAHRAAEDLAFRLSTVKRSFATALDLGSVTGHVSETLAQAGGLRIVRAAPGPGLGGDVVADEEALPFAAQAFDLVASVLALQGVNDLPGALVQIRRALKPDGLFIGCLLGGGTLGELRQAFTAAEAEAEGGVSPRVAPFADVRDMGGLLQRAGFALPVADTETVTVRYPHALALLADLRGMGATSTLLDRRRQPLRRATLMRMAAIYHDRFAAPDGRISATFDMIWLSGWAPHDSQQRPLRPGSAKVRLADALGTREIKLPPGEG